MSVIKILIVEDDAIIAEDLAGSLEASGYELTACVDNGRDALLSAAENPPDIVFMDIRIVGDMNGIETAKKLKEGKDVIVIFITNMYDDKTIEEANVVKPANYLVKPFPESQIKASIKNALYNASQNKLPGLKDKAAENVAMPIIRDDFFLKGDDDNYKRYHISDILYIEADRSYCDIHLASGKKLVRSTSMGDMASKLFHPQLMKVSRSFFINIGKVDMVKGNIVVIQGNEITVSKEFIQNLRQSLNMIR